MNAKAEYKSRIITYRQLQSCVQIVKISCVVISKLSVFLLKVVAHWKSYTRGSNKGRKNFSMWENTILCSFIRRYIAQENQWPSYVCAWDEWIVYDKIDFSWIIFQVSHNTRIYGTHIAHVSIERRRKSFDSVFITSLDALYWFGNRTGLISSMNSFPFELWTQTKTNGINSNRHKLIPTRNIETSQRGWRVLCATAGSET